MLEKITFTDENDEEVSLYVIDETKINGINYLLVSEDDSEDADCYIFKEIAADDDDFSYEPVEDERELEYIGKVFQELMDSEE